MEFIAKQACSLFIYETFLDIFKDYVFICGSVFCLQFMKSSLDDIPSFFFLYWRKLCIDESAFV